MARDIRIFRVGAVYHVTNRCYNDELRLTPGPVVNLFVTSCLAMAARKYGVQIITFMVMGNHFHLIVQVPFANLHSFMEYFQKELSHRLNRYRGRKHSNFPERYRDERIVDEDGLEHILQRILTNPLRAGLVSELADWPGASSVAAHREGHATIHTTTTTRRLASDLRVGSSSNLQPDDSSDIALELTRPNFWDDLTDAEAQARIAELIDAAEAELLDDSQSNNAEHINLERETWQQRPANTNWRPYQRFICVDAERLRVSHQVHRETTTRYKEAAQLWRNDRRWGDYPGGTFPPGWLRCLPPVLEILRVSSTYLDRFTGG